MRLPLSPQQPQAQPYTTPNPQEAIVSASPDAPKFKLQKQLLSQATPYRDWTLHMEPKAP